MGDWGYGRTRRPLRASQPRVECGCATLGGSKSAMVIGGGKTFSWLEGQRAGDVNAPPPILHGDLLWPQ